MPPRTPALRESRSGVRERRSRHKYVSEHTRRILAQQIRHLRGEMSQEKFARKIGVNRSRLSRLETNFGPVSLRTLLHIAEKLDIGLVARFVTFENFIEIADTAQPALNAEILFRARKR